MENRAPRDCGKGKCPRPVTECRETTIQKGGRLMLDTFESLD